MSANIIQDLKPEQAAKRGMRFIAGWFDDSPAEKRMLTRMIDDALRARKTVGIVTNPANPNQVGIWTTTNGHVPKFSAGCKTSDYIDVRMKGV